MKILLLTPSLNFGGVETGTIDLAKSLKKTGEEVIVVSSGGQLVKELEAADIKHIQLPVHKKSLTLFFQIPKLVKIIKDEDIDIAHAQSRMPAWVAYFACKQTHTPFVTSCHGYYSNHFFSKVMGWGKKVIVISEVIGKHMQDSFGVAPQKIRLVYRGVDLARYPYRTEMANYNKDKFRIVNISRLTPIKGQVEFIKAIRIVAKQLPNIEVWLVGSADKNKRNYEIVLYRLVNDLNLQDKVKFLGRRTDIPLILKDSDLLVLSTQMPEAFGRVIIEAGAVGVPVCATRIGGISEIIEDTKDGLLFDLGDINAMADAIIKMLSEQALRGECSRNLRKKVEEKFSLENMTKNTLEVYREARDEKNILVIKLGGLGDLILVVPSLKALRNKFPKAHISLLIDSKFEPLIKNCTYVNELILFDRNKNNFWQLINNLRRRDFDISIDFKNSSLTHWIAYLSRILYRYGFSRGLTGLLLNNSQTLSKTLSEEPVKQQLRILSMLEIAPSDEALELWPTQKDEDSVNNLLKEKGICAEDRLIGLSISASKEWPTKNWPVENFSQLTEKLIQQGFKVVLLGEGYLREKMNIFPKDQRVVSFIGETDLNQLVSLIKRLDVLITGDSAPMHIAAAVGTRIVALFGPTDPKKHIPPAKDISVLFSGISCQPCYKRRCTNNEELACLNKISVGLVLNTLGK